MKLTIIRTDGREEIHDVKSALALDTASRLIAAGKKGLDVVNLRDGRIMLVDGSGYETVERQETVDGQLVIHLDPVRATKPYNPKATLLYWAICKPGTTHHIVGDVAILRDDLA